MSCDIYAKPDLSKKVRYNRRVQEDEAEFEEREVDIYESADAIGHDHTDGQTREAGSQDEKHPAVVHRRPFTAVVLCVGVLSCLMLTGIILFIHFTTQLQKNYNQLQETISDMVKNSQLQDEIKQLKDKTEGMCCPDGWKRFGCSCYFKSKEKKTWEDSRSDCQKKGADLVVINDKEEQKFLTEMKVDGEFWIGLQATKGNWNNRRWEWEWEWVDGSPLTEMFKESGLPQYSDYQYTTAAACCDHQGRWTHGWYYGVYKYWICEK